MSVGLLVDLPAQQKLCAKLESILSKEDAFILLCGAAGSGRTTLLESLGEAVELCRQTVFLPGSSALTLTQLRDSFVSQALPGKTIDLTQNLSATLTAQALEGVAPLLVLLDDAHQVNPDFVQELCALYATWAGQQKLSLVLSADEDFARQFKAQSHTFAVHTEQIAPLSAKEALSFCRQLCDNNGMRAVYNSQESQLPQALALLHGNVGEIVKYTGSLMAKPHSMSAPNSSATTPHKKRGKTGMVLICLLIILALLGAWWLNFGKTENATPDELKQVHATGSSTPAQDAVVIDEGALNAAVPEGIEAQTPPPITQKSITLSGEELHKIEQAGAKSPALESVAPPHTSTPLPKSSADLPATKATDLAPVKPQQEAPAPSATEGVVTSAAPAKSEGLSSPQVSTMEKVTSEKSSQGTPTKTNSTAPSASTTTPTMQEPAATSSASAPKSAHPQAVVSGTKSVSSAPQPGKETVLKPENVPFSGRAIPGGSSELQYKNDAHYTVQIVAATQRERVVEISAAVTDRYWIYTMEHEGRPIYVLIMGEYPNREAAIDAALHLPGFLRAARPFAKSFATVKAEMVTP